MKIAVYTLTRDRLAYTKRAFQSLSDCAGYPYKHFVLDNGSTDGSAEWLRKYNPYHLLTLPKNKGIAVGANLCLDAIFAEGSWDLVIKMDNDCEVQTSNILATFRDIFGAIKKWQSKVVLSPRVEGIDNQPKRISYKRFGGWKVGVTGIVGGLFHVVPGCVYKEFRYNLSTPRGGHNDSYFCDWFRRINGGEVGYVEDLIVFHMDTTGGQAKEYPEYMRRKRAEMQEDKDSGRTVIGVRDGVPTHCAGR